MFITIVLQCALVVVCGLIAAMLSGSAGALSAVLGGAAAVIPNGLFAIRLAMNRGQPAESFAAVFFLGEFVKIGLTVALLAIVMRWAPDVRWPALIAGLIVALQAPLFAGLFLGNDRVGKRRHDQPVVG